MGDYYPVGDIKPNYEFDELSTCRCNHRTPLPGAWIRSAPVPMSGIRTVPINSSHILISKCTSVPQYLGVPQGSTPPVGSLSARNKAWVVKCLSPSDARQAKIRVGESWTGAIRGDNPYSQFELHTTPEFCFCPSSAAVNLLVGTDLAALTRLTTVIQ